MSTAELIWNMKKTNRVELLRLLGFHALYCDILQHVSFANLPMPVQNNLQAFIGETESTEYRHVARAI